MPISVRLARDDDQSFIDRLGAETALETLSPVRAIAKEGAAQAFRRLAKFCRDRSGTVTFVAESDGQRSGFLILLTDMPDDATQLMQAFIAYVAVISEQRHQGVGRVLVQAATAEGERRKLPHLSLMVSADNLAARSLYESEQFAEERILMTRALRAGVTA